MEEYFPGGRNLIIQALTRGRVPEQCLDICLASITESTLRQYSSGLRLWWEYCLANNIDIFSAPVEAILEFLATQFKKGASYSSLKSYKCAISQITIPDLGQDFRITRFFKGVYSLRPNLPKYPNTWDPTIILDLVKNMSNESCSIEDLTCKVTVLMLLATGQRAQTLSLIECSNILESDDKIEIKIPKRVKTSGKNRLQPMLILPFFNERPDICVPRSLKTYIARTKDIRGSTKELFITTKKPYKKASTQTICRWIKRILQKSGLDTSTFTAHSTRHAATSAAARKGINVDTIRRTAGWTQKSVTFAKFYNRPLMTGHESNDSFARAVFNI